LTTPLPSAALPSTSSAGDVYETETSPLSTRFAGATAVAYDDDDDDVHTGAVSEGEIHKFARKSVRLLVHTCHHMFTKVAFSMQSMVFVKYVTIL